MDREPQPDATAARPGNWWQNASLYQVYPRSFADGNGDGIGDLAGVHARLPYIAELGVDAVWFSPWYPSGGSDGGYDVADYRDIDPLYGTLPEAERLIAAAHALGLRIVLDIVPNHCSVRHPLFAAALAAGAGSPERELFHFAPGRGDRGELPPNNWQSMFGGPAWTRTTSPDGSPGDWYLHLYTPGQPDWNWNHPAVNAEFEATLRFWFDRGVDGLRIDVGDFLHKAPGLPDYHDGDPEPWEDQPATFDVYRAWRRIADSYPEPRALIGEIWKSDPLELRPYLGPDLLDSCFEYVTQSAQPEQVAGIRHRVEQALALQASAGAGLTWILGNHDAIRAATRFGVPGEKPWNPWPLLAQIDHERGRRLARALALLQLALPGHVAIYQGEELGLGEVLDIPADRLRDPIWEQSGNTRRGRDGCRVPIPWEDDAPPYGFSPPGARSEPWLPQPAAWAAATAAVQATDPASPLCLYRAALGIRRSHPGFRTRRWAWLEGPPGTLTFQRGSLIVTVNLGDSAHPLPRHDRVLLASGPLRGRTLPAASAAWLDLRTSED